MNTEETCPCKWCGRQARMLGTKMSDGCWELDHRIRGQSDLAQRMLEHYAPATPPAAAAAQAVPSTGRIHELKTDPAVFEAVWNGAKTFEIRLNDRDFKVGDALCLCETKYSGKQMKDGLPLEYTDRTIMKAVSHVLTGYGLSDGWCCLSFAAQPKADSTEPKALLTLDQQRELAAMLLNSQQATRQEVEAEDVSDVDPSPLLAKLDAMRASQADSTEAQEVSDAWIDALPFGEGMTAMKAAIRKCVAAMGGIDPKAQPLKDEVEQYIVNRYQVVKTGHGFWPYCVKAFGGEKELFIGHKAKCEEVAAALQTACLDGAFIAAHGIASSTKEGGNA